MTLKQRALLDVALLIGAAAVAGALVQVAIYYLGLPITGTVLALALLAYFAKTAYDIRVSQLQFEADRVERALKR